MDIIKILFFDNESLIISIILLVGCLLIKSYYKTGKERREENGVFYSNPKLSPFFKFITDFSIDLLPILGYQLMLLASASMTKVTCILFFMGLAIWFEVLISKKVLQKNTSSFMRTVRVIVMFTITFGMYVIIAKLIN